MKKSLSLILALIMLIGTGTMAVSAASAQEETSAAYFEEYVSEQLADTGSIIVQRVKSAAPQSADEQYVNSPANIFTGIKNLWAAIINWFKGIFGGKKASTLRIDLTSPSADPTTISEGSSLGIHGDVSSNYNITKVEGYILNSSGAKVQNVSCKPNAATLKLDTSEINSKLIFNNLKAGTYKLVISATDAKGKTVSVTKTVKVEKAVPDDKNSTSESGYAFIKKLEGFNAYKYPDNSQYSIGYGTRWREGDPNPCTEVWANNRLHEVIKGTFEPKLNSFKSKYGIKLSQPMYDALISFSYNLGEYCWDNSNSFATINKMLKEGSKNNYKDYSDDKIREVFGLYCKSDGQVSSGLVARRKAEANMFISGLNR